MRPRPLSSLRRKKLITMGVAPLSEVRF